MVNSAGHWLWCGILALSVMGCQGGGASPTSPVNEEAASTPARLPGTVALGSPQMVGDASLIPAAMWDVTIDLESLTASVGKRPDERSGQTYAETYLMEVTRYFTPSVMEIEGVTRTGPGRIKVDYTIAHPFAAATDPDAPASATNRADLGITGIVMFPLDVTDETPITYFAETARPIIANTDAIATADGYYVPAGLVYGLDMQANCFPFRRLVNDARRESRIGVPLVNLGVGNFDPNFGWQRSNWGPDRTGWTGYGALHQGQIARNSVELNLPADPVASISLPVMLIAKYLDPVGPGSSPADRSANRLPTADADRTKFLYRMPQAAWDLERIEVRVDGEFAMLGNSELVLQVRATDWDAKAQQSTHANLRDETKAGMVELGEAGWPNFAVSVPTLESMTPLGSTVIAGIDVRVNNDVEIGGDPEPDSGGAEDPLFFRITLSDYSPAPRIYREHQGLLRVTDVASDAGHDMPLSPWLAPLTADASQIETFQAFTVVAKGIIPTVVLSLRQSPVLSGTAPQLDAQLLTPGYLLGGSMIIDWNGDGDYADEMESLIRAMNGNVVRFTAPEVLLNPTLEPIPMSIQVRWWTDSFDEAQTETLDYLLGPNRAPTAGSSAPGVYRLEAQRLLSPATFYWNEHPSSVSDPEGDPISFAVGRVGTDEVVTSDVLPMAMNALPITSPPDTFVPFELFLCDPLHPGAEGTLIWNQTFRIDGVGPTGWSRKLPYDGASPTVSDLCVDEAGNAYLTGRLADDYDFGDGLIERTSAYVATFDSSGTLMWSNGWTPSPANLNGAFCLGCAKLEDDTLVVATATHYSTDFGGGATPDESIGVLALAATTGDYKWSTVWAVPGLQSTPQLLRSDNGDLILAGALDTGGEYSFGGPIRQIGDGNGSPYVLRLTAAGAYQWDYSATGGDTTTWALAEDFMGSIFLSGTQRGSVDYGGGIQSSVGSVPWLLALNATGSYRWSKVLTNSSSNSGKFYGVAGARTAPGCLIAGGMNYPIDLGGGTVLPALNGFLVRYGEHGEWLWERRDTGHALDLHSFSNGEFALAGHFSEQVDLGQGLIESLGNYDAYLVRCTDSGFIQWSTLWQTADSNYSMELAGNDLWIGLKAFHGGDIDLDPSEGQYLDSQTIEQPLPDSYFSLLRADTGQW